MASGSICVYQCLFVGVWKQERNQGYCTLTSFHPLCETYTYTKEWSYERVDTFLVTTMREAGVAGAFFCTCLPWKVRSGDLSAFPSSHPSSLCHSFLLRHKQTQETCRTVGLTFQIMMPLICTVLHSLRVESGRTTLNRLITHILNHSLTRTSEITYAPDHQHQRIRIL